VIRDMSAPPGGTNLVGGRRTPMQICNVSKRFGGFIAVKDVNLHLGGTGVTAIIGANGAGKTTLFNLICGQLQPSTGTIYLDDNDITGRRPHELARLGIGRGFQEVRLFRELTVEDNVTVYGQSQSAESLMVTFFRPRHQRKLGRKARQSACDLLGYLGIGHLAEEPAGRLGFAQQKLVAIARLLALQPKFLFLDEPFSGLDKAGRETLSGTINKVATDGYDVCFIEHNTEIVRELATRVIFMDQGSVLVDGSPDEVFNNAKLAEVYLGLR